MRPSIGEPALLNSKSTAVGWIFFPDHVPPRASAFDDLALQGVRVTSTGESNLPQWELALEHAHWGKARMTPTLEFQPVPEFVLSYDPRVSQAELEAVQAANS